MAWNYNILLLLAPLLIYNTISLAARTTIISAFRDSSSQSLLASQPTEEVAVDGTCEGMSSGVNSVKTMQAALGCLGIQKSMNLEYIE